MDTKKYLKKLERHGLSHRESGEWNAVLPAEEVPVRETFRWVRNQVEPLREKPGQRGARYRSADAPGHQRWFIKQYHRGGLFSAEGDVRYGSPRRFLHELLATLRANEREVRVAAPVGVFWREQDGGYTGYFVSRYVKGRRVSRHLRDRNDPDLLNRIGRILARLHDGEVDHTDFKVDNLLIDPDGKPFVTDFDDARLGPVSRWTRSLRLHRFYRFLDKHGIQNCGEASFLEGYRAETDDASRLLYNLQKPFLSLKNTVSDMLYFGFGRPLRPVHTEKMLLRAPNWLGDTVLSLPFVRALARRYPDTTLDVVCRPSVTAVYEACPQVRRVYPMAEQKSTKLPEEVERERYSMILILPKSFRTALQAWRSGIPRRRGFATQGRSALLTDRVALRGRDRSEHHSRMYTRLLDHVLDDDQDLPSPELTLRDTWRDNMPDDWLTDAYLTIHPGSAYGPAKRWPPEQFNQLLKRLIDETPHRITAIGVESEREIADEVLDGLPDERTLNLVGKTSLPQCMVVLAGSRATIANDSGIMHLSAALETPVVAVFGSSSPNLTAPLGAGHELVYEDVDCSPCFERECPLPEDRYRCLKRISAEDVGERLDRVISTES